MKRHFWLVSRHYHTLQPRCWVAARLSCSLTRASSFPWIKLKSWGRTTLASALGVTRAAGDLSPCWMWGERLGLSPKVQRAHPLVLPTVHRPSQHLWEDKVTPRVLKCLARSSAMWWWIQQERWADVLLRSCILMALGETAPALPSDAGFLHWKTYPVTKMQFLLIEIGIYQGKLLSPSNNTCLPNRKTLVGRSRDVGPSFSGVKGEKETWGEKCGRLYSP